MEKKINIIAQIKSGDEEPLFFLYKNYRNEFINWATKEYHCSIETAKDVFQEAILDFHQNILLGKLTQLTSTAKTYLFQIGRHKILNQIKKDRRITYHSNLELIKGNEFQDYMAKENKVYTQEQISEAIAKLSEDCQKVLKLHYYNEFDMDSIAREMNYKNSNTAKSKKSNCMKKLINELQKISKMLVW